MSETVDLSPYHGLWVALVNGQVAGTGKTAVQAQRSAQHQRPKDRVVVQFVEAQDSPQLALSPLLAELRPLFEAVDTAVYLVGGAVRDGVLGRVSNDLDFVVPRGAIKLAFQVADKLGVPAYVLDKERDTGRVILAETYLDFASFRGDDLDADLRDRDFTINSMALPAVAHTEGSIIDPCGGLADLKAGLIRLTHENALQTDAARALRAVRQGVSFGFTLTSATETAVQAAIPYLAQVSEERMRDELLKLLQTATPDVGIAQMARLGLLTAVLPEIAALAGVPQSPPHHEGVLAHTLSVLRWLPKVEAALLGQVVSEPLDSVATAMAALAESWQAHQQREVNGGVDGWTMLRLGALFHDVGKKETLREENGRYRFFGHDSVGAEIVAKRLHALCLSNQAVSHVAMIVRGHMRPLSLAEAQGGQPTRRAIYRFFRKTKEAGVDICALALADHLATYDGVGDEATWQDLVQLTTTLLHHYFERYEETVSPPPLINGHTLMSLFQLLPGPEIGRLLRLVEEAQAAGEVQTREEAIRYAEECRQ